MFVDEVTDKEMLNKFGEESKGYGHGAKKNGGIEKCPSRGIPGFPKHCHHNHLDDRLFAMEAMLVMMLETALKPPALSLSARATLILSCSSPSPWWRLLVQI